ncbi:DMT family transporter [Caballeronia sordidicola]|jgi:bacterial/archaeal transporter family-2 protein|uniref:Integral membrane protein n=1 Tax=Caballeronia sordidicola TaxID=196367 RepID=A0A242M7A9_CABSO|nr:DMT family transporter [Caballeronia sordidicola]MDP9155926.1 DMT family transporter [Pseudomonadota bacterium]OTP67041.1 Integral membrane protein [Caballeronia sordidicola]
MQWLPAFFAILAGISNPLQSGSNSALLKTIQAPIVAAFIVYAIGAACLLAAMPFLGFPLKTSISKLADVPWWAYIGGLCNVLFLMCTLLITKKLGSATFTTIVVISAVITSVLLDHFGLLGFEVRPATWLRIGGAALAAIGVVMIAVF